MQVLPTATASILVLAVLLGGATKQGFLGDVVVQAASCFLVAVTLWKLCEPDRRPHFSSIEKALLGVAVALCIVQLLPVFPFFGVRSLTIPDVAGGTLILSESWWSRISLTPQATWAGLVSAIVPIAIYTAVTQCDVAGRILLWRVVLVLGALALLLSILQMLQGTQSPLRFFEVTNNAEAVGFFANRNHFAAQLYVTLALAGAWIATTGRQLVKRGALYSRAAAATGGAAAFLILLTAGLAMARSRAGVAIAMGVVVGIAAIAIAAPKSGESVRTRLRGTRAIILALGFATLLAIQLGIHNLIGRFQVDMADDLRWPLNYATFGAAWHALPFGTGIGSFVRVYGAIEDPKDLLVAYANRAHNDLAEFLLETGVLGGALIVLFLIWFGRHAARAWSATSGDELYLNIQRAATLAIGGLLLHSLVDYGLRTTALSALFAFCCGLLTVPAAPETPREHVAPRTKRRSSSAPQQSYALPTTLPGSFVPSPRPAWGEEWPDEWKPKDDTPVNTSGIKRQN